MKKAKIRTLICAVVWLAAASCLHSKAKAPAQLHVVEIRAMKFEPAEIYVNEGDTVEFINKDIMVHDVTEAKDKLWTSTPLSSGDSYKKLVSGNVDYYCSIHPIMRGKVRVR